MQRFSARWTAERAAPPPPDTRRLPRVSHRRRRRSPPSGDSVPWVRSDSCCLWDICIDGGIAGAELVRPNPAKGLTMVSDGDKDALRDDARRYEQAARDALEQLDWCIGYFHGVRKGNIAAALARNRTEIRTRLLQKPAEPTPSNPMAAESVHRDARAARRRSSSK